MRKKGFTILEILIAISIFAIGILAVLQLIIRNLFVIDKSKLDSQGVILAKEGIDIIFNLKKSNIEKGINRNCILNKEIFKRDQQANPNKFDINSVCEQTFNSLVDNNSILKINIGDDYYFDYHVLDYEDEFKKNFDNNRLYLKNDKLGGNQIVKYTHDKNGKKSYFARYVKFENIKYEDSNLSDDLLKIESHVLVKKGSYTNDIVLESFIGNY